MGNSEAIKRLHRLGYYKQRHENIKLANHQKRLNKKHKLLMDNGIPKLPLSIEECNVLLRKHNIIELVDESKARKDNNTGYIYIYAPDHILGTTTGKMYVHRYVMCKHIGRYLTENEIVHHIDHDKTNNRIENLEIMFHDDHATHHMDERHTLWEYNGTCAKCDKPLSSKHFVEDPKLRKFCSAACSIESQKRFDPSREELEKLVWEMPTAHVAKLFGVCDNAVGKRCKNLA